MSYFGEKGRVWGGPSPTHLEVYTKERVIIGLHKNIKGASSMDMYTCKFNRDASEFNWCRVHRGGSREVIPAITRLSMHSMLPRQARPRSKLLSIFPSPPTSFDS